MWRRTLSKLIPVLCSLLFINANAEAQPGPAWLDSDPGAIWRRPPGFYQQGGQWYAIIHTRPEITRVRLVADFTDRAEHALDLTHTPDGKFWWFRADASRFARPPRAGDCYHFVSTRQDGGTQQIQDPAARWVESSDLAACSRVTVTDNYVWHDAS